MSRSSHPTATCLKMFSLSVVLLFSWALTVAQGSITQEQERIVTKLENRRDPVKISLVKTKRGAIEIDKGFIGDDDWFRGLSVRVKNSSGKAIVYLRIELFFPRDKSYMSADPGDPRQTLPYSDAIGYGGRQIYMPDSAPFSLPPIPPGDHVDLELSDRQYQDIKIALAQLNFSASIKQIEVRPEVVYFEDGTLWQSGAWYQRDPKNPRKLYLMTRTSRKS